MSEENKKNDRVHSSWVAAAFAAGLFGGMGITWGVTQSHVSRIVDMNEQLERGCAEALEPARYWKMQSTIPDKSCICIEHSVDDELKLIYTNGYPQYQGFRR